MAQSVLNVRKRERMGKSGSKAIRKEGNIPAVLYGKHSEPVSVVVNPAELKQALATEAGENTLLQMHIKDGSKMVTKLSVLREVQMDHVTQKSIHLDFLELNMNEKFSVKVPVKIEGRAIGVHEEKGMLEEILREVQVECLPMDIPNEFVVDVTDLHIGESVHVSNLEVSEKITILDDPASTIITVVAPKVEKVAEAAEEEGEEAAEESAESEEQTESAES